MAPLPTLSITMIETHALQDLRDALKQESELRVFHAGRSMTHAERADKLETALQVSINDANHGWTVVSQMTDRAERAERVADEAIQALYDHLHPSIDELLRRVVKGFIGIADLVA